MQPPNLAPTPLTPSQRQALIEVLTKGGMPELFFASVLTVVEQIALEAIRHDCLACQGDPFYRRALA